MGVGNITASTRLQHIDAVRQHVDINMYITTCYTHTYLSFYSPCSPACAALELHQLRGVCAKGEKTQGTVPKFGRYGKLTVTQPENMHQYQL